MKTMKKAAFNQAVKDGRVEVVFEQTRAGFVTFRNTTTGNTHTVQVVD